MTPKLTEEQKANLAKASEEAFAPLHDDSRKAIIRKAMIDLGREEWEKEQRGVKRLAPNRPSAVS